MSHNVSEDEKKLVKRCLKGDRASQEAMYNRFAPKMLGVCMRYTRDRATAEDLLQEGFIKVFKNLDRFRFEGSFEGWIRRIMVNTAIEHHRKHAQQRVWVELEDYNVQTATNGVIDKLSKDELLKVIQSLPEGYRAVFNLYVMEQYSHKEIAKAMNISEGTSKSQLARARNMLQEKLEQLNKVAKKNYAKTK